MITEAEKRENRIYSKNKLSQMKKIESNMKEKHILRLDKNTIVCANNIDRINDYKNYSKKLQNG